MSDAPTVIVVSENSDPEPTPIVPTCDCGERLAALETQTKYLNDLCMLHDHADVREMEDRMVNMIHPEPPIIPEPEPIEPEIPEPIIPPEPPEPIVDKPDKPPRTQKRSGRSFADRYYGR